MCLLLLASCGDDDSSDEGYAAIESASFTFDETTPANNAVRVIANTGWQVFWTPESAAVRVEPASGSGNGVFYVRDMPKGASVQVGVRAASGKTSGKPVTVTRAADAVGVTLSVAPAELLYDPASPASNVVTVTTNASWKAACPNSALKFSPASGTGSTTITIADAPAGQRTTLTVTAGEGSGAKTATCVIVRNPETPVETVFSLDFGNGAGGVWAGANQEWKTQTGTGASTVTYAVNNVRINNDNYGSAGKYSGASGKAYAKMFYNASTDYFVIQDISLPAGQTNFTLAFGAIFPADDVSLTVSADGAVWKPLVYTGASAYNMWTGTTVGFTLAQPVPKLWIRLAPTGTERAYGLNFDDIRLSAGGGGQQVDLGTTVVGYRWAELPATPADMTHKKIHTFWASTVTSKQYLRNYTYCYDTRRHSPLWIAHPQHACYQEGGWTRPATDPWAQDPNMTVEEQAVMWPIDGRAKSLVSDTPEGPYQWQRGHLLASSYRGCGDKNNPAEINKQTFLACNISAQRMDNSKAFQTLWAAAERRFTDQYVCADTLYCVSGAYFADENTRAYDCSWISGDVRYSLVEYSKECIVPTHYYKLLLRTRSGNLRKPIQECSAGELKAVGFWFENADVIKGSTAPTLGAEFMVSVEEIEKITGFTFFPDVPAEVKRQCVPSDWGF